MHSLVWVALLLTQNIPGLGSDPLKKGPLPPIARERTEPPARVDIETRHVQTLDELHKLIDEATALESELQNAGAATVPAGALKRVDRMRRQIKLLESRLRGK